MTAPDRISVTQLPGTISQLQELTAATGFSKSDLFNIGLDVLHFLWHVLRKGGEIGVKMPGDDAYKPVAVFIPGIVRGDGENRGEGATGT